MPEGVLEALFERFRTAGDAEALGRVFDRASAPLFSIARRLTSSRAEAEDVVQSTWLTAIERANDFDATRRLEPWLVGILVRHAHRARRERGRTIALAAEHDRAAPQVVDPLESRELAEVLSLAFDRLTDSERAVLVPLLVEDRRAIDLAHELGLRPDTLHMRVHRGLARLRRWIPAGRVFAAFVARRDAHSLATIREKTMQLARPLARGVPPITGVIPLTGTSLAVSKLAVAAALAAATLVAVTAARPWRWFRSTPAVEVASIASVPTNGSHADASPGQASKPGAEPSRAAVATNPPPSSAAQSPTQWWIVGQLSGASNGDGTASILAAIGGAAPSPTTSATAVSASDGSYSLDVTAIVAAHPQLASLYLNVDHPTSALVFGKTNLADGTWVTANGVTRLEMHFDAVLQPAAVVRAHLRLANEDASTWRNAALFPTTSRIVDAHQVDAQSGATKSDVVLRAKSAGKYALYVLTSQSAPATRTVDLTLGQVADLGTIDLSIGSAISGSVDPHAVDPDAWIVGARRKGEFGWGASHDPVLWKNGAFVRLAKFSSIDATGAFSFTGLDATQYEVALLPKPSTNYWMFAPNAGTSAIAVTAPASGVQLGASASVLELSFAPKAEAPPFAQASLTNLTDHSTTGVTLRAELPWKVALIPGVDYELVCSAQGWQDFKTTLHAPLAGQTVVQPVTMLKLGTASFHWTVVDAQDQPITNVAFGFVSDAQPPPAAWKLTMDSPSIVRELASASGTYDILDVPIDFYTVRVHAGAHYHDPNSFVLRTEFQINGAAADTRTLKLALGGKVRITSSTQNPDALNATVSLTDAAGQVLGVCVCQYTDDGGSLITETSLPVGAADLDPNLAAGDYTLTIVRTGFVDKVIPLKIVAGQVTSVAFDADAP